MRPENNKIYHKERLIIKFKRPLPTGNIETRFVNRISWKSLKSKVLSSSPKYKTPSLILLFFIQVSAARRLETPRGIDL